MKLENLSAAQRLIVGVDLKLTGEELVGEIFNKVDAVMRDLDGTGVTLKFNSALRAIGYGLCLNVNKRGFGVFADLKLKDIPETMETDAELLARYNPQLLTVMCSAGVPAMKGVKERLPHTEVLGVTVLTSMKEEDTQRLYGRSINDSVLMLAEDALAAGLDGLIASPAEAQVLRARFGNGFSINTPAIRPQWAVVPGDDQNKARSKTPAGAITAGADRIVVGRPIMNHKDRRAAAFQTIAEIETVLSEE